jgi:hypothetical protein
LIFKFTVSLISRAMHSATFVSENKFKAMTTTARRPLFIDFDIHTDGDQDFKNELVTLMIDNILELQSSFASIERNGHESFLKAVHKMKSTIEIINDRDLSELIAQFRSEEESRKKSKAEIFNSLCKDIIHSLQQEIPA